MEIVIDVIMAICLIMKTIVKVLHRRWIIKYGIKNPNDFMKNVLKIL